MTQVRCSAKSCEHNEGGICKLPRIDLEESDMQYKDCGQSKERKDEPQTIRCPKCGRSDYIREFGKDFSVTAEKAGFKYKCINCNTYIEPQIERSEG